MRPAGMSAFRAVCVCLLLAACRKHAPVSVPALAPSAGPVPAVAPVPDLPPAPNNVVTAPVVSILDQAARAFSAGNYEEAAKDYESFLHSAPPGAPRDFALFYLGLCFA